MLNTYEVTITPDRISIPSEALKIMNLQLGDQLSCIKNKQGTFQLKKNKENDVLSLKDIKTLFPKKNVPVLATENVDKVIAQRISETHAF